MADWDALSGLEMLCDLKPRALPWAAMDQAVGLLWIRPLAFQTDAISHLNFNCGI